MTFLEQKSAWQRACERPALCPLCAGTRAAEVQSQCLDLVGTGRIEIGFGYCTTCGHIYQTRQVVSALIERHYALFSNYTCFDREAARSAPPTRLTRRLQSLAQAHAPAGMLYEVGCATGYHLFHLRRAGWQVGGCDPSPKAAAQARQLYDIAVNCGTDAQMLPRYSGLAAVLFSHVLEHMVDPGAALALAYRALRPDGVVLLEVPCAVAPDLMPPGWLTFEHLHYFTEASLINLLTLAGFVVLETRTNFHAENYPVIAAAAAKAAEPQAMKADALTVRQAGAFLTAVVARDEALWHRTAERLSALSGPIYVWGAGVHTAQLFSRTPLRASADVLAIVDRDDQKWGYTQAGCTVISPGDLLMRYRGEPVVISSYAAEAQIAADLLAGGVAPDRIIRLYPDHGPIAA